MTAVLDPSNPPRHEPRRGSGLHAAAIALTLLAVACAPRVQDSGPGTRTPELTEAAFIASDGRVLPYRVWRAGRPQAIVVGLHGFNDYSNAFEAPARYWAANGITTYAYDQRGFGATEQRGIWAGEHRLTQDLREVVGAIKRRHADLAVTLVGESMGGAVIMAAEAEAANGGVERPAGDGIVLVAPAVWGRATMPLLYRAFLWLGAHVTPWNQVTASGLNIVPSDNIEMLKALGRDPQVIKHTRIDSVWGLVNLMDDALAAAPAVQTPALVLYGAKDEIVPKRPTVRMLETMNGTRRVAVYPAGYHMLLRDLQAETVWRDVAAWIRDRQAPLPSQAEVADVRRALAP